MPKTKSPITQLPSGRWQVRYRDDDDRQQKQTFDTFAKAQGHLEGARTAVRQGTYIDPKAGQQRFGEYALEWAEAQDWKDTTRESFPPHLRRLTPHIGQKRLSEIDTLTLQRLRQSLADKGYARSTITITMHYATAVMRSAYQTKRIGHDATLGIKPPKRRVGDSDERVGPDNVPTREEVIAIVKAAPEPYRAAIALGVAGLRIGEVMGVTADRFNPRTQELKIDRQRQRINGEMVFTGPKREKVRTIKLPSFVAMELRRHIRDHQGGGLLFRGMRDAELRRDQFYNSAWKPALKGAGLEPDRYVFHSLRHFCASAMLAEGVPITAVAKHLGDTVETVMKTYAHWLRDEGDIPATTLDRLLLPEASTAAL